MIRSIAVSCLLSCFALAAGAQGEAAKPTNAAPAAVRDFGAGFRQFQSLGLPDLKGAEYCTINAMGMFSSYSQLSGIGVKGNGWLLPGATGPTLRVASSDGAVATVWRMAELQKLQMAEVRKRTPEDMMTHMDRRIGVTWKAADVGADLDRLLKRLQGKKAKEETAAGADADALVQEASADRDWELESGASSIFLLAAMAYSHGETNAANQVCQRLFDRFGNRKVIAGGIEALAKAQLEQAKNAFEGDGDWKAYAATLEEIAARFAKVWPKVPAVRLIASRVRGRADGAVAPVVAGLSEADQRLVRELAEQGVQFRPDFSQRGMMSMQGDAWVMQRIEAATNATPAERLLARGVEAVPVLAAIVTDRTPMPPQRNVFFGRSYSYSSDDDDADYTDEKVVEEAAAALPGPQTLGAWARSLLLPVMKGDGQQQYEMMRMDAAEFQQVVRAWYDTNKGRSPLDLAREALASDDSSRRDAAIGLLAKSSNTADQALIEKVLVEADPDEAYQTVNTLQTLARLRGNAASGLVERVLTNLEAQLKAQLAGASGAEARQQARMQAWVTNQLGAVRALVSGKKISFEDALREWVALGEEKQSNPMASMSLQQSMAGLSPRDLLGAVLRATVATSGAARARAATMLQWAQYAGRQRGGMLGEEEADAPTNAAAATDFAAEWRTLLNDQTPAPDVYAGYYTNLAAFAAISYVGLFDKEFEQRGQRLGAAFDEAFLGVIKARALALLDGKGDDALPALPSADQVAESRRATIRKDLLAAAPAGRHAFVGALGAAERLWLFEEATTDETIRKALMPETSIIRRIDTSKAPEMKGRLDGAALDRPINRAILEACLNAVSTRQVRAMMLQRGDMMRGASLIAISAKGSPYDAWVSGMVSSGPGMTGVVAITYVGSDMVRAFWPIGVPVEVAKAADPKPADPDAEASDELGDDVGDGRFSGGPLKADAATQANFWKRVEEMLSTKPEDEEVGEAFEGMRFFMFALYDPSAKADEASEAGSFPID